MAVATDQHMTIAGPTRGAPSWVKNARASCVPLSSTTCLPALRARDTSAEVPGPMPMATSTSLDSTLMLSRALPIPEHNSGGKGVAAVAVACWVGGWDRWPSMMPAVAG